MRFAAYRACLHTPKVVECKTVVERPKLTVVESIVGDETASIVLSVKNEQGACQPALLLFRQWRRRPRGACRAGAHAPSTAAALRGPR